MPALSIEQLCERGQEQLIRTEYLDAEATLEEAEREALAEKDWDRLSRLYMPLQEARRQRRQRCGEGMICLDLLARGPDDQQPDPQRVLDRFRQGQLLVAGWGTLEPARRVRELAAVRRLYVETFLGAVYPVGASRVMVIVPTVDAGLPQPQRQSMDQLVSRLPPHCIIMNEDELPRGVRQGTYETYGQVMALWERLHRPFLAQADAQPDPVQKIEAYRQTIRVDYACELAHQNLSAVARELARQFTTPAAH